VFEEDADASAPPEEVHGPRDALALAVISIVCAGLAYALSGWKPQEYFFRGRWWLDCVIFSGVSGFLALSVLFKRLRRGRW
jgi:hypothetical protein